MTSIVNTTAHHHAGVAAPQREKGSASVMRASLSECTVAMSTVDGRRRRVHGRQDDARATRCDAWRRSPTDSRAIRACLLPSSRTRHFLTFAVFSRVTTTARLTVSPLCFEKKRPPYEDAHRRVLNPFDRFSHYLSPEPSLGVTLDDIGSIFLLLCLFLAD